MTQVELDALPEFHRFSYIEEIIDGRTLRRPVINHLQVEWVRDDEPMSAIDAEGNQWTFVRHNGVLHEMRHS